MAPDRGHGAAGVFSGRAGHALVSADGALLEIYWVAAPDDPDDPANARRKAQEALDARKRLRDFAYSEEPGQKCGLWAYGI